MAFTDALESDAAPIWAAIADHPMVQGIGDGSLEAAPFRRWLRQDYVYLIEYARLFALGAAKAPDLDRMGTFAGLLTETLDTEMALHREYAADFGITPTALEATEPMPTTRGYTDFLLRTAALAPFGDLVAALLPCMWGYRETAERLAADGLPDHEGYATWIETYAGEEFSTLTDWCLDLMDDVAAAATAADCDRFRVCFLTSTRYEYRFWDAVWRGESWSV